MKSFLLPLVLFVLSFNAFSVTLMPKQVVENIFKEARNPKLSTNIKLQNKLSNRISFVEMAKNSLGSYKNKITKEQFNWFSTTLKEIITGTVYPEAPDFFKNVKVSYEEEEVKKAQAHILSIVTEKGEETEVAYSLKLIGKQWKVVDVALDDESWTESISEEVIEVIKKEKWAGLKKKLTKRLKEIRNDKK